MKPTSNKLKNMSARGSQLKVCILKLLNLSCLYRMKLFRDDEFN